MVQVIFCLKQIPAGKAVILPYMEESVMVESIIGIKAHSEIKFHFFTRNPRVMLKN